jgi:hypothetical protein
MMRIILWTAIIEFIVFTLLAFFNMQLFKIAVGIILICVALEALAVKFDAENDATIY